MPSCGFPGSKRPSAKDFSHSFQVGAVDAMGRPPVDMFKSRLVDMLILLMDGVVGILGGYFGRSKTLSTVNDCISIVTDVLKMIVSDVCDHLPEKVLSYLVPMVIGTLRPLYRLLNPYLGCRAAARLCFPRSLRCVLELNIMSTLYSISPQASQHVVLPSLLHESSKDKKWSLTPQLFFLLELGRPPKKRKAFHEQGGCADT